MRKCKAKHTAYQPIEWKCPNCGNSAKGDWVLDFSDEDADEDCTLNHKNDELKCYKCGFTCYGSLYARRMKVEETTEECPCCKGKGWVKK